MSEPLHSTVVVSPGILDIGIKVETYKESAGNSFFIFFKIVTWFGADKNITLETAPTYLMGKYEGFEQTMKVEAPADLVAEISPTYHEIGVTTATGLKEYFKLQFFAEMAKRMNL